MRNIFIITKEDRSDGSWYQLIIRELFFTFSCASSEDDILACLRNVVIKYRSDKNKLFAEVKKLEGYRHMSDTTKEHVKNLMTEYEWEDDGEIENTIDEAEAYWKKHNPLVKPLFKPLGKKPLTPRSTENTEEIVELDDFELEDEPPKKGKLMPLIKKREPIKKPMKLLGRK